MTHEIRLRELEERATRIETKVDMGFEKVGGTLDEFGTRLFGNGQPGLTDRVAIVESESKHCIDHRNDDNVHMSLISILRFNRLVYVGAGGGGGLLATIAYILIEHF